MYIDAAEVFVKNEKQGDGMKILTVEKYGRADIAGFEKHLQNLRGTVEVESVEITKASLRNMKRLVSGEATCSELVNEIIQKYMRL